MNGGTDKDDSGGAGGAPGADLGPASILLVDDHAANLLALEAILAPLGHALVRAQSGEEALKQILRRDFALILLDVQMSGMNGFETAALIKQHTRSRHIPIIFITAISQDAEHVFKGYSQGAVDYLLKPFEPEILRSKASVFIDLHLKGERIKLQERLLRQREREVLERRSEHRYRSLIDSMPQCVWAMAPDGAIYYWNRACLDYCGITAEERPPSFWHVVHAEDRGAAQQAWERSVGGPSAFERQLRIRRGSDGAYRWHLARGMPERDEHGVVVGWIVTATDIDDQKQAEDALKKAVSHRDDFLSVASHELRTPLTSLKLELNNLGRISQRNNGTVEPAKLNNKLTKIEAQAERLHRLIDHLLDVSRVTSGRLEIELDDVDLTRLVTDIGARFEEEASRVGCRLTVVTDVAVVGRWDRNRLEQVITNLLSNALKYGSGKPVSLSVDMMDGKARVVVRDQGVGISPDDQERIFGRFERAVSTRNFGGIGLGLWIVKEIVGALGGRVSVQSALGAGSTFTVELPRQPSAEGQKAGNGKGHHATLDA
jgi:PAS domain S-box-containing protein